MKESFDAEPFAFDETSGGAIFTRKTDGTLYVHFPDGLLASGFELPCEQMAKAVSLLNNGQKLNAELAVMPSHALLGRKDLHVFGLDAEMLATTVPIVKIVF